MQYITYDGLIQISTFVVILIGLVYTIYNKGKK